MKIDLIDGLDLSELLSLFGGQNQTPQPSGGGLLSGLMGGNSGFGGGLLSSLLGNSASQADQDSSVNGNQLLSLLSMLR